MQKSRANHFRPRVLATDLDGTLIPNEEEQKPSLETLRTKLSHTNSQLVFVTGRDFGLTTEAISENELPRADWIICDVGTSVMHRVEDEPFELVEDYRQHLKSLCADLPREQLQQEFERWGELRLQEESKQGEFKLSFYTKADEIDDLEQRIQQWLTEHSAPWSVICSVDPFTNDGLVDFLPKNVSKAYALEWWRQHESWEQEEIVFAGDSGNDFAALTAGYLAVVVGNAHQSVINKVRQAMREREWLDRLHVAEGHSTTGVLEGCRAFGLF
ncbi:MAG: HAD-IIB family hydrolase [Planctomycetaceae bacterium]|nr:HAD-IIB family hydrolase [Planctomycetaceae bacterium]